MMKSSPSTKTLIQQTGLTLHRVTSQPRSLGDGEEQVDLPGKRETLKEGITLGVTGAPEIKSLSSKTCSEIPCHVVGFRKSNTDDSESLLKQIDRLALCLNKASILNVPDSQLLNVISEKVKPESLIPLYPQKSTSLLKKLPNAKRKEPNFVPYEPYKACVKPINILSSANYSQNSGDNAEIKNAFSKVEDKEDTYAEIMTRRLTCAISDYELQKTEYEERLRCCEDENNKLQDEIARCQKELKFLQGQLCVQSQVNSELKKLLIASVGEDVQGHVQCLTEDKTRMAAMIRHYSEKIDRDFEEKEKMNVQCDLWRSKFLASSVLIGDLANSKGKFLCQLKESHEALKVLLEEIGISRQHLLKVYQCNKEMHNAFDPLKSKDAGKWSLSSSDIATLAIESSFISESLRDHLLGVTGRNPAHSVDNLECQTPGEKMAHQALEKGCVDSPSSLSNVCCAGHKDTAPFYQSDVHAGLLAVNCCANCNGFYNCLKDRVCIIGMV